MHYLMAVTSMKSTSMKSTHREVDEIDFSIYVRKTGKWQIKCFEYITCHKIMYVFCTVAPHCDWLSYQRDQLRISQSTNTWIKEFLSQTPESRSFFRRQITGEMPRISRCACGVPCSLPPWRPSMKPLIAPPAPFDETIDRGSGPTCSLFPHWRPSMKPSIAPPVLFDETIDRDSGPTPLILLLHVSFELCRSWQLLLLHVSLATVVHLEHSSWASYGRDNQEEPSKGAATEEEDARRVLRRLACLMRSK